MHKLLPAFAIFSVVLTATAAGNNCFASATSANAAACCPFCNAPSLTLAEEFTEADIVALVRWKGGEKATDIDPGSSKFEIVEIPRNQGVKIDKKKLIELPRYRAASDGDLFVLMGTQNEKLEWNTTRAVSKEAYAYMSGAPSPDESTTERLKYYLKYLEHEDETIAMDAYGEFANAPYKDITPLKNELPREKISKWAFDPETSPTRLSLYGLLLGLCGNEDDAKKMEAHICKPSKDYRLGLDAMISGYLLLKGDKGLDVIDKKKLATSVMKDEEGEEFQIPFSETYAVVGAVRFMWTYADTRIPKARLKKSMRLLLNRPAVVDLIIPDLARWKDWEISEQLFELYGKKGYDQRAIKLAITKFLIHCSRDVPKDAKEDPAHVVTAKKLVEKIKEMDPKTVRDAKRTII
ncbi:MAG: hypothetical protein AB8G99_15980 [Planctomycetaceae bacterium]